MIVISPIRFLRDVCPVVVFLCVATYRCFLETTFWTPWPYFSYYTLLHHILWVGTMILIIMFLSHIVTGVAPARLIPLFYGSGLLLIPLIWVVFTGDMLDLRYLNDSPGQLVIHALTFNWSYPPNRPLTPELVAIFLGMAIVGYQLTSSLWKAMLLAVSVHAVGILFAIQWFGCAPNTSAVFAIRTNMDNHILLPFIYVSLICLLILVLLRRQYGTLSGVTWRTIGIALGGLLLVTPLCFLFVVERVGKAAVAVDAWAIALPVFPLALIVTGLFSLRYGQCRRLAVVLFAFLFVLTCLVTLPFSMGFSDNLVPRPPPRLIKR
jgi:hypothetical protein